MTTRSLALFVLLLCATSGGRLRASDSRDAEPAEPVLAAMSISYPVRMAPVLQPARQSLRSMVTGLYTATTSRFTTLSNTPSLMESLDALPVIGTVRRRAGHRFNTDDASISDFAICYRLSSRIGLQMIPGDPAPVKLAISSLHNNSGITLGMTLRLSRR